MKKINLLIAAIFMIASFSLTAQVAITASGGSADATAILDVQSTSKGFLPPRMTEAEMNTITSPAAGLMVYCTDCTPKAINFFNGTFWINMIYGSTVGPTDVYNPATGKIWMDRNLGATQVATSSTDSDSYGDLYQWGRYTEGHEVRTSGTTSTTATTAVPNDGNSWDGLFIAAGSPYDWLASQDNTLWQGVSGPNNPCPSGYRLPTETELNAERLSWATNNAAGAFGSPLKLTVGGYRIHFNGTLDAVGSSGYYWSSTVNGIESQSLGVEASNATMISLHRSYGFSVRCIKD